MDNSLGRYWIERHPESRMSEKLKFFVTPKNGETSYVDEFVKPEDIRFFEIKTVRLIQRNSMHPQQNIRRTA